MIYINDAVEETMLDGNFIALYADDMLLFRVIPSTVDFYYVQGGIISNIGHWVENNYLKLNVNL